MLTVVLRSVLDCLKDDFLSRFFTSTSGNFSLQLQSSSSEFLETDFATSARYASTANGPDVVGRSIERATLSLTSFAALTG